jgi:uncharacterized UBP type Zn finger protein
MIRLHVVVLAGLEFGLPADGAREAVLAMTDDMRSKALWWLWNNLRHTDEDPGVRRADERWRSKVEPWLSKAWPRDPGLKTPTVGQRLCAFADRAG